MNNILTFCIVVFVPVLFFISLFLLLKYTEKKHNEEIDKLLFKTCRNCKYHYKDEQYAGVVNCSLHQHKMFGTGTCPNFK